MNDKPTLEKRDKTGRVKSSRMISGRALLMVLLTLPLAMIAEPSPRRRSSEYLPAPWRGRSEEAIGITTGIVTGITAAADAAITVITRESGSRITGAPAHRQRM